VKHPEIYYSVGRAVIIISEACCSFHNQFRGSTAKVQDKWLTGSAEKEHVDIDG
jgi:hypothetical protein